MSDGALSKKTKFMIHAAITASQHDVDSTLMHLTGAIKVGASEEELLETAVIVRDRGSHCSRLWHAFLWGISPVPESNAAKSGSIGMVEIKPVHVDGKTIIGIKIGNQINAM
ncbi:MAG: carboxymuconolactone decarboxylase family protein [Coprothermobacterota bacterium]|nr:carboxymuconolactone decarboxylase family protein [Coprothermobacterota bacterium]